MTLLTLNALNPKIFNPKLQGKYGESFNGRLMEAVRGSGLMDALESLKTQFLQLICAKEGVPEHCHQKLLDETQLAQM